MAQAMTQAATVDSSRPTAFRVALYDSIRRTAHQQRDALRRDDLDTFHDLLQERERLLAKVEDVSRIMPSTATNGDDTYARAEAATIVREILSVDEETSDLLAEKLAFAQRDIVQINSGRTAVRGYSHLRPVDEMRAVNRLS